MRRRGILAIAILAMAPVLAGAETLAPGQALNSAPGIVRYTLSQWYLSDANRVAVEYDRQAGFVCASQYTLQPQALSMGATIELPPGAAHPISGAWRFVYDVTRCEQVKRFHAFYAVGPDGVSRVLAVAGHTLASVVLLKDAWSTAVAILQAGRSDCGQPLVLDTRVSRAAASPGAAWQEEWIVVNCGPQVAIHIDFTPSPRGGTDFAVRVPARPR
jgi:hypothetical protein